MVNRILQETKGTCTKRKEHQLLKKGQIHPLLEAMVQDEVLELLEEEEMEMVLAIPVEMKDQIREKV